MAGDSDSGTLNTPAQGGTVSITTNHSLPGPFQKYNYGAFINSPAQMGMKGEVNSKWGLETIGTNFGGLISYVELLVNGTTPASRAAAIDYQKSGKRFEQPLGNAYIFNTGFKCKDSKGELKDAVAYMNNIPLGNIPFISGILGAGDVQQLRGLLPGMFEDLNGFNPMIIMDALEIEPGATCNLDVETKDEYKLPITNINEAGTDYEDGKPPVEYKQFHMFDSMVSAIDPCLFKGPAEGKKMNPVSQQTCRETFANIDNSQSAHFGTNTEKNQQLHQDIERNLQMLSRLNQEDWIIQLYMIAFSILLIFILIKTLNKTCRI